MKRVLAFLAGVLCILAVVCVLIYVFLLKPLIPKDPVLEFLPKYETREFYTSGGFQDYTDYAKYTFGERALNLEAHPNLRPVTREDIPEILAYLEDFEGWVDACQDFPKDSYDFRRDWLTEGDFFYLYSRYEEPEKQFWSYNVYYFRQKNQALYYFHNNI